jgi:hypothetical protein
MEITVGLTIKFLALDDIDCIGADDIGAGAIGS